MWVKESYLKDNGIKRQVIEMALVYSSGQMVQSMRACGERTKLQAEVE
jgi:hypothetical protein